MKLISRQKIKKQYERWDLTVKRYHNYVVEGIVVHNSNARVGFSMLPDRDEHSVLEWKAGSHKVKRKMPNEEDLSTNTYWYPFTLAPVKNLLVSLAEDANINRATLFGEVYGKIRGGHKSMSYGRLNSLNYVAFSLKINGNYVDWAIFNRYCERFGVRTVPVIDVCSFNMGLMKLMASGPSLLAQENGADHMREGIVIVAATERKEFDTDRAILKMLNPDYLLLKNKKEAKGETVDFKDE